jgi:uncharacterized protein (TIGR02594 family)
MDRDVRNGQEQAQKGERAGNSRGTPGKTTLTQKLPARGGAVQRQAAGPASPAPDVAADAGASRGGGDDPSMDVAHRGAAAGMVVQRQTRGAAGETAGAQGESVTPPAPAPAEPQAAAENLLTPAQVQSAQTFYSRQASFWPGPKVAQVSQKLGIAPRQAIDEPFVQAAASFQRRSGLGVDGMLGDASMMRLFSGAEMDRAHTVANRITAVYESAGNYGVVQTEDVGIVSYGAHQVTLASGNLGRMLQDYLNAVAAANAHTDASRTIQGFMARVNNRAEWEGLRSAGTFHQALRDAGREQIMRDTQDAFFSQDFWVPAVQAGLHHGITSQLGFAALYDCKIQGGMEDSLTRARESLGGIVGATVPREGRPHVITEAEFLIAFNEAREGRLERIAQRRDSEGKRRDAEMLRNSQARPQAFEELARAGNLDLSSNVEGQSRLGFRTYGGRRAQVDVPAAVGTAPAAPVEGGQGQQPAPAPEQGAAPAPAPAPAPGQGQGTAPAPEQGAAPAPEQGAQRTYQVRSGDTLAAIAGRLLGNSERWREIAQLNGITNPRALRVGQVLRIPGEAAGAGPAAGQPAAPTGESPAPAPQPGVVEYRVRAGDTLAEIAERLLGSAERWQEIARANGITDPRTLRIGQVLRVPGGNAQAAARQPAPRTDRAPQGGRQGGQQGGQQQGGRQQGGQQQGGGGGGGGTGAKPAWISVAEAEVGTQEIAGRRHNPRIIEYHSTTGRFSDDETAWCASFVNWVLRQAGKTGTGSAMAMSFASYGTRLERPAYGSIAVISYGGGRGHVGFVVGRQGDRVLLLGGNQSNGVNVRAFGTSQIVAYVVPPGYEVPAAAFQLGGGGPDVAQGGGVRDTR